MGKIVVYVVGMNSNEMQANIAYSEVIICVAPEIVALINSFSH